MRKITLLFLLMCSILSQAQLKDYVFTSTVGSFAEITTLGGATTLGNATANGQIYIDPSNLPGGQVYTGSGFEIGFTFTYDGRTYDKFGVSNEGWISLGSKNISPNVDMRVSSNTLPL